MYFQKLQAHNFKNYKELSVSFSPEINIIIGPNGSGKTNLLDALYFLCLSKSAFHSIDHLNILREEDFFMLKASVSKQGRTQQLLCSLKKGERKIIKLDKKPYDKISEHIGKFPLVLIAPNDTDLIREGGEERRKFLDSLISQLDAQYLDQLLLYNRLLKQRNALLKSFAEKGKRDMALLETFNARIIPTAEAICKRRQETIEDFVPLFLKHYEFMAGRKEKVELLYQSQVKDSAYRKKFQAATEKDLMVQRTTMGIHKDDLSLTINDLPLKSFGSQGQQKSFVIAMKLAQFELLFQKKDIKPILLLDDIFDKLDTKRIEKLLQMIEQDQFGQIFITDARLERSEKLLDNLNSEIRIFKVLDGTLSTLSD